MLLPPRPILLPLPLGRRIRRPLRKANGGGGDRAGLHRLPAAGNIPRHAAHVVRVLALPDKGLRAGGEGNAHELFELGRDDHVSAAVRDGDGVVVSDACNE